MELLVRQHRAVVEVCIHPRLAGQLLQVAQQRLVPKEGRGAGGRHRAVHPDGLLDGPRQRVRLDLEVPPADLDPVAAPPLLDAGARAAEPLVRAALLLGRGHRRALPASPGAPARLGGQSGLRRGEQGLQRGAVQAAEDVLPPLGPGEEELRQGGLSPQIGGAAAALVPGLLCRGGLLLLRLRRRCRRGSGAGAAVVCAPLDGVGERLVGVGEGAEGGRATSFVWVVDQRSPPVGGGDLRGSRIPRHAQEGVVAPGIAHRARGVRGPVAAAPVGALRGRAPP
mmetsp:Transcript_26068/g.77904  ORF Transcript_26068/g.77904 Transcript_26068/m.77904 type:complete len:282 (-) Transcript_26068:937-1782(-)